MDPKQNLDEEPVSDESAEDAQPEVAEAKKPDEAESSNEDEAAVEAGVVAVGTVAIWFKDLKKRFKQFWDNKKLRYSTLGVLTVLFIALFTIPLTRYGIFNLVGLRGSAEVVVLDKDTAQPLRNVTIEVGKASGQTDDNGVAKLYKVRLGDQDLVVKKNAYADVTQRVRVGFGSNKYTDISLEPIGTQFAFKITHWLSGQPVDHAEVSYNESSAFTNEHGEALLTTPPIDDEAIEVTVSGEKFQSKDIIIDTTVDETHTTTLVAAPRHYFVSKRSGKFDIYSSNLDGSDQKVIIQATGKENEDMVLAINSDNHHAALATTRDGVVNGDGYALHGLFIVDLETSEIEKIDESELIQVIDWMGTYLVYVRVQEGLSGGNVNRHELLSYNLATGETKKLANSNYFNDVLAAGGHVYYAKSNAFLNESEPFFQKIKPDGSSKQTPVADEVYNIWRGKYSTLTLNTKSDVWFDYDTTNGATSRLSAAPTNPKSYMFIDGPEAKKSVWVDERDGKGALIVHDNAANQDTVLYQTSGLVQPVRWVYDDLLIFRVVNDQETADYVISVNGGEPKKISDVSNVNSITRWYYY